MLAMDTLTLTGIKRLKPSNTARKSLVFVIGLPLLLAQRSDCRRFIGPQRDAWFILIDGTDPPMPQAEAASKLDHAALVVQRRPFPAGEIAQSKCYVRHDASLGRIFHFSAFHCGCLLTLCRPTRKAF